MEDACIHEIDIGDGNSLFAVFDGHGGTPTLNIGAEVSQYVSQIFIDVLKGMPEYKKQQYTKALDLTFKRVDELIDSEEGAKKLDQIRLSLDSAPQQMGNKVGNGVGCTANVLLITPDKYYIANAGDSRSALYRDGRLVTFSEDHKPESSIEEQRITKAGGMITMGRVNGGLNLSRSFGDFDYKRNVDLGYDEQMITCKPDIKEIRREKGDDFILMGCDGIWERYVEDSFGLLKLVKQELRNKKQHRKLLEELLDKLLAKDTREGIGCDNMSAILIVYK